MNNIGFLTLSCIHLFLLLPPFTTASSTLHVFSHASGWSLSSTSPSPHLPSATVAFLQLQHTRVYVRRIDAAPDAGTFQIKAASCGGAVHSAVCSGAEMVHEMASPLNVAAFDLSPLLYEVAGNASPYGCSHVMAVLSPLFHTSRRRTQVVNPSIVSTSSISDSSSGSVTLVMLRASVLTGQQLQRATFALARVGATGWRLLTHDFVAVAPDPLRLPVNVLPMQVSSSMCRLNPSYVTRPPPHFCSP